MAGFRAERQEMRMRQGDHLLLLLLSFGPQNEFDVDGIGVANGDPRLEPSELHFPGAAKRIGTSLKAPRILCQ